MKDEGKQKHFPLVWGSVTNTQTKDNLFSEMAGLQ